MARLPMATPAKLEPLSPWAEDWFGEHDVRDAIANGLRGDELADHLAVLCWQRYSRAYRSRERYAPPPPRWGDIGSHRTLPETTTEAALRVRAMRRHLFERFCAFSHRAAFLAAVETW